MRLLMISIDRNILDENSAVARRVKEYAAQVAELRVLLLDSSRPFASLARFFSETTHIVGKDWVVTTQDPFELGLIAWLISKFTPARLHVQVHIDFFSSYFKAESFRQHFQAFIAPFVLKRAAAIRVVSKKIADYLEHDLHIEKDRITVAPIFVDAQAVPAAPVTTDLHQKFPDFTYIVLVAARFVKQKNIPLAIEAFEKFAADKQNVGLVIVGSGPEEKDLYHIVGKKDLGAKIKIANWKTEFFSCMKTADVFLLSSNYEGWGMTVVEAAAAHCPVIMTDVGCAGEFIEDNVSGIVVPVGARDSIAASLGRVYTDRATARKMADAAFEKAANFSSPEEYNRLILASWQAAIEKIGR